jgi:integrase
MEPLAIEIAPHTLWNKGKLVGQKAPFKLKEIWAIRIRLQLEHRARELAFFDLGIDSKLRGCDLVKLKVQDVCHGNRVACRAIVMQQKTKRPVQFEITAPTREAVEAWIKTAHLAQEDYLFYSPFSRRSDRSNYAEPIAGRLPEKASPLGIVRCSA